MAVSDSVGTGITAGDYLYHQGELQSVYLLQFLSNERIKKRGKKENKE